MLSEFYALKIHLINCGNKSISACDFELKRIAFTFCCEKLHAVRHTRTYGVTPLNFK